MARRAAVAADGSAQASADGEAESADRPRIGRPPRISRQMIAESAHGLGLEGLTLKAVADDLGVSIAALYHHVSGKDDLMRLTAEYAASMVPLPVDRGQHWAVWLYEWAIYNRDAFLARPGLLAQYLDGAISVEAIAGNVDTVLRVLTREGFTILEANDAYELITSCALGTAVGTIRERQAAGAGRVVTAAYRDLLAGRSTDELPHLRALLQASRARGRQPFHERVATVLRGIAVRQGLPWEPIDDVLAAEAPPPGRRR